MHIYAYMHAYIHSCKHAHNARARRRPVTFRCNRSLETGYIQMKPDVLMLASKDPLVSNFRVDRHAALLRNIGLNVSAPKASDKLYDATLVLIYTSAHRMTHYFSTAKHLHHTRARRRPVTFRCNRSPETGYIEGSASAASLVAISFFCQCNRFPETGYI